MRHTQLECTVAHAHVTLGDDENPCQVVFPLDTAVDRLCVTPKGSIPPALGVPMFPAEVCFERIVVKVLDIFVMDRQALMVDF